MKIPKIYSGGINKENINYDEVNKDKVKKTKKRNALPFLNFDLEKNRIFPNISNKVKNASSLISTQTDKLLLKGFEGSEEDFVKCYKKKDKINFKKISNIKQRKINNFLIKEGFTTLRLTKTKEFNLSSSKKNKILEQIRQSNQIKSHSPNNKIQSRNNSLLYNLLSDNSLGKTNKLNKSNSIVENIRRNKSQSLNIKSLFNKKNSLQINMGNTFYFYNKNSKSRNDKNNKLKHRSQSLKDLSNLKNILNDTSNNASNIKNKLKKFVIRNKIAFQGFNSTKNKTHSIPFFQKKQNDEGNIKEILEFSGMQPKKNELKLIKNDIGLDSENIWMKKSTANLILFGKSFLNLNDIHFYQERKRILADYPKLEKEAEIDKAEIFQKGNAKNIIRLQKLRFDRSNRKIEDLNKMTDLIMKKMNEKIKEIKKNE